MNNLDKELPYLQLFLYDEFIIMNYFNGFIIN